jgi:ribonuclease P protein subunit POP4
MIAPRNILRHEFIGLDVLVVEAKNPLYRGLIRTQCGDKRVPKPYSKFRFILDEGVKVEVDGSALIMAPEKRITQYTKNRGK